MTPPPTMETITSTDGTYVAYERGGSGPPLVQGGSGIRLPFEEQFTIYEYDRHASSEGTDAAEYTFERQFEDVTAIVESIDEPVILYGHSLGALRSLEAALRTDNLRKLILYEPPLTVSAHHPLTEDLLAEMTALNDDGENEQLFFLILTEIVGVTLTPAQFYEDLSTSTDWQDSIETVHKLFHDLQACGEYAFDAARFAEIQTPTLLLTGGKSPQWFKDATDAVDDTLPNSRIAVLDGQAHFGTDTELFIEEVLAFIR